MYKNIHVVINPASGKPEPILSILNQVWKPHDITWDNSVTLEPGDCTRLVREALERGVDLVAVYGGDGTIMEAANGLMGSSTPLLVLPGGTGNVFSIELGIPQDTNAAVELAVNPQARTRAVDVGQCGERYFLLRVGIGFAAEQINLTSRELRDKFGKLAYFIAALQAMPKAGSAQYHIQIDGEEMTFEGATCLVENAGNIGIAGTSLVPDVHVDDGLLDLVVLRGVDLQTTLHAFSSILRKEKELENLDHRQGREFTIRSDPPQSVVADGEPCGETPCTVKVHPSAIKVIVPPEVETAKEETPKKEAPKEATK
jgi:YegS/Rv2252/BmrU family lipid kinase